MVATGKAFCFGILQEFVVFKGIPDTDIVFCYLFFWFGSVPNRKASVSDVTLLGLFGAVAVERVNGRHLLGERSPPIGIYRSIDRC